MTMAPARAVTLIKPHTAARSGHREALPRWGIAVLVGLLVCCFFVPWLTAIFVPGRPTDMGSEPVPSVTSPTSRALWGVRLGFFAVGSFAGWFVARPINRALNRFLAGFNWVFDRLSAGYGRWSAACCASSLVLLVVYGGLLAMTVLGFKVVPKGFIPEQDKGYLVVNVQLPDGASLERTDRLVTELSQDRPKNRRASLT